MSETECREELKPCPFCGGKADLMWHGAVWVRIECHQCRMQTKPTALILQEDKIKLIMRWNRRQETKPLTVEQIENICMQDQFYLVYSQAILIAQAIHAEIYGGKE